FGVAIEKQPPRYQKPRLKTFSVTLGARTEQNPYSGELAAMAHALGTLATGTETVQGHAAHEQQSGGSHAEEPSTAVGPGTHLPSIQADQETTEAREAHQQLTVGSRPAKIINC
ncbi:hypothetical protein PENNAL_c0978G02082, partial [Penicillium nalgiovense]